MRLEILCLGKIRSLGRYRVVVLCSKECHHQLGMCLWSVGGRRGERRAPSQKQGDWGRGVSRLAPARHSHTPDCFCADQRAMRAMNGSGHCLRPVPMSTVPAEVIQRKLPVAGSPSYSPSRPFSLTLQTAQKQGAEKQSAAG